MKILDIPKSGKCGVVVAYRSRYGQCLRQLVVPKNSRSPARERMHKAFGQFAQAWGELLTEPQREAWNIAGPNVQSAKRLGQGGPLTGQQHFQGINSARACIGKDMLLTPPEPVVFDSSPVGQLVITNGPDGIRVLLPVTGPVADDIMVFGQTPCSRGRTKRRNVSYLGLPPPPQNGLADITALYVARFGELRPRMKLFIVTRQQRNGWESFDRETSAVVPENPAGQQVPAEPALPLTVHMHKGCTRDAEGVRTGEMVEIPGSREGAVPEVRKAEDVKDAGGEGGGAAGP